MPAAFVCLGFVSRVGRCAWGCWGLARILPGQTTIGIGIIPTSVCFRVYKVLSL